MRTLTIQLPEDVHNRLSIFADRFFGNAVYHSDGRPHGLAEMAAFLLKEASTGERCMSLIAECQRDEFMKSPPKRENRRRDNVIGGPWKPSKISVAP